MNVVFAVTVGFLFAAGLYMILRRSMFKIVLGLSLWGQASNLLLFAVGGPERGAPPIIPYETKELLAPFADPVPQALILTAIVIGFGAQAFAIVLVKRIYQAIGYDDMDFISTTDK